MRASPPKRGGKPSPPSASALRRTDFWICLAIIAATLTVYSQVRHYEFVNFDDPEYVGDNIHVRAGLTANGVAWALQSLEAANWFPLTWLSHMIDYQLFGMDSGWNHLTNVWLHALSALLLYAVLLRMTSARWPSAFVAFLFALHPLHVESVAWIAERKDVLCALFWFLTIWFYARYVERPGVARYLMTAAAFGLGLMSKPMIVTLPFALLLLDVWPLGRAPWPWKWNSARSLVLEKLPLLAMAAGCSALTFLAQRTGGAVAPLAEVSLLRRIGNALLSYVAYIRDMFWPSDLAVLYPLPRTLPVAGVAAAGAALAAISVLAAVQFRKRPYLAIGWFWYVGTLVPVIGLVQVGTQARADRYTYIPLIGLFLLLAWGAAEFAQRVPRTRKAVVAAAALACSGCVAVTWFQIQYWATSETLFRHSLEVAEAPLSHNNLGNALMAKGRLPEAIREFRAALRLLPGYADAHFNLGIALENLAPSRSPERLSEAIAEYRTAARIEPRMVKARVNLGAALGQLPGRQEDAIAELQEAIRLQPDSANAHECLGSVLSSLPGRQADAIVEFRAATRIAPDFLEAHYNLAYALAQTPGSLPEAIAECQEVLRIDPANRAGYELMASLLAFRDGRR